MAHCAATHITRPSPGGAYHCLADSWLATLPVPYRASPPTHHAAPALSSLSLANTYYHHTPPPPGRRRARQLARTNASRAFVCARVVRTFTLTRSTRLLSCLTRARFPKAPAPAPAQHFPAPNPHPHPLLRAAFHTTTLPASPPAPAWRCAFWDRTETDGRGTVDRGDVAWRPWRCLWQANMLLLNLPTHSAISISLFSVASPSPTLACH